MFSITRSRAPRPKLRVTCRISAPSSPHMSHRLVALLDPRRDDDNLRGGTDLDDAAGRLAVEHLTFDDVLSFESLRIALPFNDFTCEDDVFNVEEADFIVV